MIDHLQANPLVERGLLLTRRQLFGRGATGIGLAALSDVMATAGQSAVAASPVKAKRVVYLFQSGAPSHIDLFDYKPQLASQFDKDLPDSIRNGQRITGMTSGQTRFPCAPTTFNFKQYGKSGIWMSINIRFTSC